MNLNMVVLTYGPLTQEAQGGRLWAESNLGAQNVFQAKQINKVRPRLSFCLQKTKIYVHMTMLERSYLTVCHLCKKLAVGEVA